MLSFLRLGWGGVSGEAGGDQDFAWSNENDFEEKAVLGKGQSG